MPSIGTQEHDGRWSAIRNPAAAAGKRSRSRRLVAAVSLLILLQGGSLNALQHMGTDAQNSKNDSQHGEETFLVHNTSAEDPTRIQPLNEPEINDERREMVPDDPSATQSRTEIQLEQPATNRSSVPPSANMSSSSSSSSSDIVNSDELLIISSLDLNSTDSVVDEDTSARSSDTPEDQPNVEPAVMADDQCGPQELSTSPSEPDFGQQQQSIPQPPNREQIEEPVVDAADIIIEQVEMTVEPDAAPVPDPHEIKNVLIPPSSEPEPPAPLQSDDDSRSSVSLHDDEIISQSTLEESTPAAVFDDNLQYSIPKCGIWGDSSFARRQHADISILYKLFQNVDDQAEWLKSSNKQTKVEAEDDTAKKYVSTEKTLHQEIIKPDAVKESEDQETTTESKSTSGMSNEFVDGLDDIDDLFVGIEAPDELDVGSDGSSFQEVLMGSATRVIIKRITRGAKFTKEKLIILTTNLTDRLRDEAGELKPLRGFRDEHGAFAPLRKLRNDDGDLAPLRILRDENGDFAPLRKLRDADGQLRLPTKEEVIDTAKQIPAFTVRMGRKLSDFFDRVFQGDQSEEKFDYSFVPDQATMTGKIK